MDIFHLPGVSQANLCISLDVTFDFHVRIAYLPLDDRFSAMESKQGQEAGSGGIINLN